MASQTQGIQKLLSAEKKADERVTQARKRKTVKLKKAKEEAQGEVLKFREVRDSQFKEYENEHMGSKESNATKIEADTTEKIKDMEHTVEENKGKVINYLMSQVFEVSAKLHQNFRND